MATGMLYLHKYRGTLALQGSDIDQMAATALASPTLDTKIFPLIDPMSYHITLLTKQELKTTTPPEIKPDTRHVFALGVGGKPSSGVYWVVIIWAAGQQIRRRLGLPPKHFHITLSSNDIHDIDKGIASLLSPISPGLLRGDVLDHVIFTLQSFGQYAEAKEYALELALDERSSQKGWLRFADAAFTLKQFKLSMLSYACAWEDVDAKAQSHCLKRLIECSRETEWGHVFREEEISQLDALPKNLLSTLLTPWSEHLKNALSEQKLNPTLCLEPRHSLFIPSSPNKTFYKLPRFFRWLVPYYFAIMSTPRNQDDIKALSSPYLAIRHVLTLTQETALPESWFRSDSKISNTFLPIPNYHPPSIEQMDLILQLFKDETRVPLLVHCGGGKGRAGTVAACYLAAYGFSIPLPQQDHPKMSSEVAIPALRALRPGSLETSQQEAFVSTWCSTIWKRRSVYPDLPSEPPPCPLEIHGDLDAEKSDFVVLVGLPGSGKTWFSKSLVARDTNGWVAISQDEIGSRAFCEAAVGRKPQKGRRVLLDRCNISAERKQWLDLASNWCTFPICVWFDYDEALCTARAQMRANHPTLTPGNRVRNAVKQMREMLTKPTLQEGWKAILVVKSFEAAQEAVLRFSPLAIFKFPRTPHLIDIGAATKDDLHIDLASFSSLSQQQTRIVITEKIDGANMGFSLSSSRNRIIVQNRSHYVNSASHEQFKKLNAWLAQHDQDLRHVLDKDLCFAERYILFGEWVFTTHSIAYTDLPDWFLAYDLYDRSTKTFIWTSGLEAILEGTNIRRVPILFEGGRMPTKDELLQMVRRKSVFYDGEVEGVYVKVEEAGCVKFRSKVVRSDFIAGNEHWTKGHLLENGLLKIGSSKLHAVC